MPSEYSLPSGRMPVMIVFTRGYVTFSQIPFSLLVQRMNRLFPPSSLFNSRTACAVVPDPAKKSNITESFCDAIFKICRMSRDGLGVSKITPFPIILNSSFFASSVCPTSLHGHHVQGVAPSTSERYLIILGCESLFFPK